MTDTIKVLVKSKEEIDDTCWEAPGWIDKMDKFCGKVIETVCSPYEESEYMSLGEEWHFRSEWVIPVQKGVWYENRGVCPVPEGTCIDVLYRNGETRREVRACDDYEDPPNATSWSLNGGPYDIMHWRYSPIEQGVKVKRTVYGAKLPEKDSTLSKAEDSLIENFKAALKKGETPVTAQDFLSRAMDLLDERGEEYDGEQERSMAKTVKIFNIYKDLELDESDGWLFMEILKNVRQLTKEGFHQDSAEDGVSYSALKAEALAKGE